MKAPEWDQETKVFEIIQNWFLWGGNDIIS